MINIMIPFLFSKFDFVKEFHDKLEKLENIKSVSKIVGTKEISVR